MKLLVYGNRKQDDEYYDVSTTELEEKAYRAIFKTLDEYWGVYADIEEFEPTTEPCEACAKGYHKGCAGVEDCSCVECGDKNPRRARARREKTRQSYLYREAKGGNFAAMKALMNERRGYEYEGFKIAEVNQ